MLILFAIFCYLALAIETAVPYFLHLRFLIPNLVVILAVDLGLRHRGAAPAVLAFAMGYAVDAFSGSALGVNAFLMTAIYLGTYEISSRLLVTNAMVGATFVFLGTIVAALGDLGLSAGAAGVQAWSAMLPTIVAQAAITALVAPIVFSILSSAKRTVGLPVAAARE